MISVFYTTINDSDKAEELAEALLNHGLVACVNIIPSMKSVYKWKGEVCKDEELVLLIKSDSSKFSLIEDFFEANHPYDTPCLLELKVGKVSDSYNSWLINQLT